MGGRRQHSGSGRRCCSGCSGGGHCGGGWLVAGATAATRALRMSTRAGLVPVPVAALAAIANGRESPLMGSSEFYHFRYAEDLLDHHRFSTSSLVEDFSANLDAAFHGPAKKPQWWRKAWSLWGLIHRRAAGRRSDAADRTFSEPLPELRGRGYNARMQRCNSNASARSSFSSNSGGLGSSRRSYVDAYGNVKWWREERAALERNRVRRPHPSRATAAPRRQRVRSILRRFAGRASGPAPAA